MRIKKYICMKEEDDFVSDDQFEAYDHMELGSEHIVAEVILDDGKLVCSKLAEEEVEINEDFVED